LIIKYNSTYSYSIYIRYKKLEKTHDPDLGEGAYGVVYKALDQGKFVKILQHIKVILILSSILLQSMIDMLH
jgi:hypothetical protein